MGFRRPKPRRKAHWPISLSFAFTTHSSTLASAHCTSREF
jgi:hypothetical protein